MHATQALTLKSWENGSYPSSTGYLGTRMTEMVPGLQRPVRREQIPKSKMETEAGNTPTWEKLLSGTWLHSYRWRPWKVDHHLALDMDCTPTAYNTVCTGYHLSQHILQIIYWSTCEVVSEAVPRSQQRTSQGSQLLMKLSRNLNKAQNESHRSLVPPHYMKDNSTFSGGCLEKNHHHHHSYGRSVKDSPEERKIWVKQVGTSIWMTFPRKKSLSGCNHIPL